MAQSSAMKKVSFGYSTSGGDSSIPDVEDALGPVINILVCGPHGRECDC